MNTHPSRIVCLSSEASETLCLLGEGERIVGFSGPTARLPVEQHSKPRVSVQASSCIERVCELEPDLVLGLGEQHSDVLGGLAQRGIAVHLFNQRTVRGILNMIRVIGGLVGRDDAAAHLAATLEWRVEAIRARSASERRPRIYFEEWDEPSITASTWVAELIAIAGGENCFPELAHQRRPEARVIHDTDEVIRRSPDIIVAAWNGKPFRREDVLDRDGWFEIPALMNGELHEIPSSSILQPGPAALTDGLDALQRIVESWRAHRSRIFQTAFPSRFEPVAGQERVA